jgi:hypothetical protein
VSECLLPALCGERGSNNILSTKQQQKIAKALLKVIIKIILVQKKCVTLSVSADGIAQKIT